MLTDDEIKFAPIKDRDYKIYDGKGLYVLVTTRGTKLWRYKYRMQGKEKTLSFGNCTEITAEMAREEVKKARILIKKGHDPSTVKKVLKTMTISSPVKILRKELKHLEDMKERLESKKRDIVNQLDDVSYDLNEVCGFLDELRHSIKYLEEGLK